MSDRRNAEAAAERVRSFLVARSRQGSVDPHVIYSVSSGEDILVELRVADLEALLRAQLGPDAVTVDEAAQARARRSNLRGARVVAEHLRGK